MPTFPKRGGSIFAPGADPISSLFAGSLSGSIFGAPTASASIGATGVLNPAAVSSPASSVPADQGGNAATAAQRAYQAGEQALGAAKAAISEAKGKNDNGGAGQLKELEGKFQRLESEFSQLKTQVGNLQSQNQNRA